MGKSDYAVRELVPKIERGELELPQKQPRYVWTSTKMLGLRDLLYREYNSGVIPTWRLAATEKTRAFAPADADSESQ